MPRLSTLIPLALPLLACLAPPSRAHAAPCGAQGDVRVWFSPETPVAGRPLSIMATAGDALPADAQLFIEDAPVATAGAAARHLAARLAKVSGPKVKVELRSAGKIVACRQANVARSQSPRTQPAVHWQTRHAWDEAYEEYFSAWVHQLFAAAPEASVEFRPLALALWDPKRNSLHNHLGLHEDEAGAKAAIKAAPDCADLPYVLRAYFAWKLELPFGFRECDRGNREGAPRCTTLHTNQEPSAAKDALAAFKSFQRILVNKVHSGSLRTALDDDDTDFYPVPLTREALRPGTIFADPYGHVLVVSSWVDRKGQPGLLFAVDGQPDTTVARKRFWEGNFLYANDVPSAGAGFKAFRPLVEAHGESGTSLKPLQNEQLARRPIQPFDKHASKTKSDAFYARMFALINPRGLPATVAYDDVLQALVEQMEARVRSVDNGEQYMRQTNNRVIDMPEGPRIFETVGPWEDYATPSRDMRLLIAIKVLEDLPGRITRHPELFSLGGKAAMEVRAELEARHARLTTEKTITYKNSDGKDVTLTVADVLARRQELQVAYNPNDCVEVRWGAKPGSAELASCRRRAPAEQRDRMLDHRTWFAETRRPARE